MIYQVHTVNRFGARIGTDEIECDSDEEATETARQMLADNSFEIWCGNRKVAAVNKDGD